MKRNILIIWIIAFLYLALVLTGCSHDDEPIVKNWEGHETLNIDDSLAVVRIYKALDYQNWRYDETDSVKRAMITVDLEDYNTWHFFKFGHRLAGGELIITGIDIDSEKLPEGFFPDKFQFPLEFGLLKNISYVKINLTTEPDKEYSRFVDFPTMLFDNPIETLDINGDRFGGTVPKEIGKLGHTLRFLKITHTNYSRLPHEMALLLKLHGEAVLTFNKFSGKIPYFPPGHPLRYCNFSYNQFTEMNWEYFRDNVTRGGDINPSQKCPYIYYNPLGGMIPEDVMDTPWWAAHHLTICTFSYPDSNGFDNCRYCPILSAPKRN